MCLLLAVPYNSEIIAVGSNSVEQCTGSERMGGGEVSIHYDYIENGQLKGGVVNVSLPPLKPYSLIEPLSEWPVTTIISNGAAENRIDIVCVGDGYTSSELGSYATHVQDVMAAFFAQEPLAAYASYFNVHRVDVISNESGVDELDSGIYRDTALDMAYGCFDTPRLLCIDRDKARAAASNAPEVEQIIALANSTKYGGAGYADLTTAAGNNKSSVELILHEYGHSFVKLGDEYYYRDGTIYTGAEPGNPNASIYDAGQQQDLKTKWYRWLDLPNVDTFEGAKRKQYGIYRPTDWSKMRTLGYPFEAVNVEQFVISFYKLVSPIDDATPATEAPLPSDTVFFVAPMEPADHSLDVQWSVDGVDVPGATGLTFVVSSLPAGTHDVAVKVVDNTARVRDETARANWLTDTRQWQIEVGAELSGDCFVDFVDFGIFARQWRARDCWEPDWCGGADFELDGDLDFADLSVLAGQWLVCECEPCILNEPPAVETEVRQK